MAKASITNIRPTSGGTPAKTTWALDTLSDQDAYYGDAANGRYDSLISQLSPAAKSIAQAGSYSYVFLGINGGADETIVGRQALAGVIVSGNGKDNVTGGALGDLVFSGNGVDVVHGGAGDDKIYGENGSDQLFGDGDNDAIFGGNGVDLIAGGTDHGPAPWTVVHHPGTTVITTETVLRGDIAWLENAPADGVTAPGFGNFKDVKERGVVVGQQYDDNEGSLQKVGSYQDGNGDIHNLFSFDPADLTPVDTLNAVTFTVAVYQGGLSQANYLGKVGTFSGMEDQQVFFSVNVGHDGAETAFSDGNHIAVFYGDLTEAQLAAIADPQQANLKSQGMNSLADYYAEVSHEVAIPGYDEWVFAYAGAGDVLTGGADADTFVYAAGDGVDEIVDYARGIDMLKLVGIAQSSVEVRHENGDSFVVLKEGAGYVADAAIRLVGVADFDAAEIQFA